MLHAIYLSLQSEPGSAGCAGRAAGEGWGEGRDAHAEGRGAAACGLVGRSIVTARRLSIVTACVSFALNGNEPNRVGHPGHAGPGDARRGV